MYVDEIKLNAKSTDLQNLHKLYDAIITSLMKQIHSAHSQPLNVTLSKELFCFSRRSQR